MILTTNRITSLDIAVQSRIHLAIQYQDLSKKQKCNIFESFLKQLEPDDISDYDDIMEYVKEYGCEEDLNGRQSMSFSGAIHFHFCLDQPSTLPPPQKPLCFSFLSSLLTSANSEIIKVRNIVSSALSLARIDKKNGKLTERHLKDVLNITKEFQKQLDSITRHTRGMNEADRRKGS